jgi:hypothetical protein
MKPKKSNLRDIYQTEPDIGIVEANDPDRNHDHLPRASSHLY